MNILPSPKDAAISLARSKISEGFNFEALYEYQDKVGGAIYWRIRLKHPQTADKWIRPMMLVKDKYVMGEPKQEQGKILYRLRELADRVTETVFICEGEKCVDSLMNIGVLATTSGAAQSALAADWTPLAKRNVIIWPDNDTSGYKYCETVTTKLKQLGCNIKIINVSALNLMNKGDVVDWLNAHPDAAAADIFTLPLLDLPEPTKEEVDDEKQTQTTALVSFVISNTTLFHDKNHEVYAQDLQTKETRRLDSRQFKDWLVAKFFQTIGKAPRDQSYREALGVLSGLARYQGSLREVFIRVGKHQDGYYLDLGERGNSRAIEVKAESWKLVDEPPIYFLRPDSLQPLPAPIKGGDISSLWEMANIPEGNQLLVIAWLCECLRLDTPFPVLELIGEQGSAKSTTQTILRKLIDPNACNLRGAPKTIDDIFVTAGVNWLVSYENISHLSPPMQDTFCILATGGGFAKRKLYSDADESVINVQRPIILNGISVAVTAQDLVDRTLSIETPIVKVRTETVDIKEKFDVEHGKLLGALLDIMAAALKLLPSIELAAEERPRLLEFARFGMAIAVAMKRPPSDFLDQFKVGREEAITRTIDASPVASALIEWFDSVNRRTNILPVKELFKMIEDFKPSNTDSWPRSAKGFADALRRAAPALRQIGIECKSLGKTGGYVSWEVKAKE